MSESPKRPEESISQNAGKVPGRLQYIGDASTVRVYYQERQQLSDQPYGGEREEPARENCKWKDINAYNGDEPTEKLPFPTINDKKRELPILLGLLDPSEKDEKGMPVTARVVFIFGPDKKLKLSILYPATTGRNFDEILRVIKSLQLTATKWVATLVDWKEGESVMVLPTIAEEEAKSLFPKGVFTKDLPSARSTSIIPRSLNSLCGSSDKWT
ncbi:hypothetical protein U0070_011836 [Myodes glareolus]|uniref:Peroxiredoxin-6 n=1 Tax=Myodes glareolus TaxID=447135 RepID=A0AAW0K0Y5_MYOGA